MKLTQDVIDVLDKANVPEDDKQDFYVAWLEDDGEYPEYMSLAHLKNHVNARLRNKMGNKKHVAANRERILEEHAEDIRDLYGKRDDDYDPGPEEEFIREETIEERLKLLSPLLRATAELMITGGTIGEIAEKEYTDTNTIYQRLHQIRKILEENNNG